MNAGYTRICEFIVNPDHTNEFEHAYGPFGDWVQLFRCSPAFLRLELHRDRHDTRHFVTVDYWDTQESIEALRARYAAEFQALESRCERYVQYQAMLGQFELVRYNQCRTINPR